MPTLADQLTAHGFVLDKPVSWVDEGDPVESTGFVIGLRRFDIECFADEIIFSADPSSPGSVPSVYSFPHTDDGIARLAVLALKYRDALSTAA